MATMVTRAPLLVLHKLVEGGTMDCLKPKLDFFSLYSFSTRSILEAELLEANHANMIIGKEYDCMNKILKKLQNYHEDVEIKHNA